MNDSDNAMLTTGQAASMLGTTTRHVRALCERGELPYTLAGTHRRLRRADVLTLSGRAATSRGGPMTDDQVRSLWLHRAAAGRIARDPERALAASRRRIERSLEKAERNRRIHAAP